jgi:hypothetical protein
MKLAIASIATTEIAAPNMRQTQSNGTAPRYVDKATPTRIPL